MLSSVEYSHWPFELSVEVMAMPSALSLASVVWPAINAETCVPATTAGFSGIGARLFAPLSTGVMLPVTVTTVLESATVFKGAKLSVAWIWNVVLSAVPAVPRVGVNTSACRSAVATEAVTPLSVYVPLPLLRKPPPASDPSANVESVNPPVCCVIVIVTRSLAWESPMVALTVPFSKGRVVWSSRIEVVPAPLIDSTG